MAVPQGLGRLIHGGQRTEFVSKNPSGCLDTQNRVGRNIVRLLTPSSAVRFTMSVQRLPPSSLSS